MVAHGNIIDCVSFHVYIYIYIYKIHYIKYINIYWVERNTIVQTHRRSKNLEQETWMFLQTFSMHI